MFNFEKIMTQSKATSSETNGLDAIENYHDSFQQQQSNTATSLLNSNSMS